MKQLFFICTFLLIANLSFCQTSFATVQNATAETLEVMIQTKQATPNNCMAPPFSTITETIEPFSSLTIELETVAIGETAIRPFRIWAETTTGDLFSWQVNQCWNPMCVFNFGPLNINFSCISDFNTTIMITE